MLNITRYDLMNIKEPLRYTGKEYGEVIKNKYDIKIRVALCYPNLYEIGMNNHTMMFLYNAINNIKNVYAERCYMPYVDFENLLKQYDLKLYSLETKTPLDEFDFVIFVISDELEYINIVTMLKLAHINMFSKDRKSNILIGFFDDELKKHYPLTDIFDIFIFNNLKAVCEDIFFKFSVYSKQRLSKMDFLNSVNSIESAIVPSINNFKEINKSNVNRLYDDFVLRLPVSNISTTEQILTIKYNSNNDRVLENSLNLIRNTGITNLEIIMEDKNYKSLYNYIYNLQCKYDFLNIVVSKLPFNKNTLDIYMITRMIDFTINFNILNNENEFEMLFSNIKLAQEKGANNIVLNVNIGDEEENYHDLEKLVLFIFDIKELFDSRGKFKINIINKLNCDFKKVELKQKFLKEKLMDLNCTFEDVVVSKLRCVLQKDDTSLVNLLSMASSNKIRIFKNKDCIDTKMIQKTFEDLNSDIDKYLK